MRYRRSVQDLPRTRITEILESCPRPRLPEQAAIVRFLDHADRRIRRYIRAKQKLITLLEEQKQAIIHQAVTGQIDVRTGKPYQAYKPSGVEWLGDVPEHWELCRLRNVVSIGYDRDGERHQSEDRGRQDAELTFIARRGSHVHRFVEIAVRRRHATRPASYIGTGRTRIKPRDLLVSVTAYIGSVGIAPEEFEEA